MMARVSRWVEVDRENSRHGSGFFEQTERLRVPGGWIYRSRLGGEHHSSPMAMVFVPEPKKNKNPIRVAASRVKFVGREEVTYRGKRWHWEGSDDDNNEIFQASDGRILIVAREAEAAQRSATVADRS